MSVGSQNGGSLIPQGTVSPNVVGGKVFTPAAYYPSSSGKTAPGLPPGMFYTVCEVSDGSTSCDCPGWTRRNPAGGRTCKHIQDYETFLRPLWNRTVSRTPVTPMPKAPAREMTQKGGSLSELFAKLDKAEGGS